MRIYSPLQATVVQWLVAVGDTVDPDQVLAVIEAMKMEHEIRAGCAGRISACLANVGDLVQQGEVLVTVEKATVHPEPVEGLPTNTDFDKLSPNGNLNPNGNLSLNGNLDLNGNLSLNGFAIRPDLAAVIARHAFTLDENRASAVAKRHALGFRTARENIAALCDENSFMEYGALAVAAQAQRRTQDDLMANTPADGMVTGIGKVNGASVAVLAYDATVLAGTQGMRNHQKTDRLLGVALAQKLPVVLLAEGGGGRPGETDMPIVAGLHVTTFASFARLRGHVPVIGIAEGRCFAGNAALLGCCDLIIATRRSNIGMGGPAMIEGGGLGIYKPEDIGPFDVQHKNGVIDVLVDDEVQAVEAAKRLLPLLSTTANHWHLTPSAKDAQPSPHNGANESDPNWLAANLRSAVPERRIRAYDTQPIIEALADTSSVIHLKTGYGIGIHTALGLIGGRFVGIMANNPLHLGGAIDADAADKAALFINFCTRFKLPIVSLIDTPGFMVGPESEAAGHVRYASSLFIAGAAFLEKAAASTSMPFLSVVLRKGYGLGAMAMSAGGFHASTFTLAWPTAEFGAMGLEGAVRLGFRKELEACATELERDALFEQLLAQHVERGSAINMAATLEIDAVIDPAQTREWLIASLTA
ncbi:MAG: carboxyl transferase domain-containing protein [Cytophagales bacterium]|nr:carboxyl transferase domain-containing protein [Cytophagales bacterium]